MKYAPATLLHVFLDAGPRRKVGRLALQDRRILFEYDSGFLASGLQISPLRVPLRPGVIPGDPSIFDGLPGVFNDSLPDGWGRLLLDRAVEKLGIRRGILTPLDRLAHVGPNGMGALSYEPDYSGAPAKAEALRLDRIAAETATVLSGEGQAVIDELLRLNGASAGARPKVVAQVSGDHKRIIHGAAPLEAGFSSWLIKFPSAGDAADIGRVEYAYSLMARAAGITMPETHLFKGNRKAAYFGAKRFDRDGGRRLHMHSLSGLIHADHRMPAVDYDDLLKAALILTKDARELVRAFELACFNVLAHNRDDHAKNVSFLMDQQGRWTLAPAYDLTFSEGPAGEQSMMVMGEGREPGPAQLLELAKAHGIKRPGEIIARVSDAVARWHEFAEEAGVAKKSALTVTQQISPRLASAPRKSRPRPAAKKKRPGKIAGKAGR